MPEYVNLIIMGAVSILFYFLGRRSAVVSPSPVLGSGSKNLVVVDTSALIDGRILDIAKTGFVSGKLIIYRFILDELQHIADSSNPLRRSKGRRGLKVLKELKKVPHFEIEVVEHEIEDVSEIDKELVTLAKENNSKILTTDYNLNEVANIQNVVVLNINELSNAIKPVLLPGEVTDVKVVQKGKESGQGVGYLEDGTMIVVENGERFIGRKVTAEVSRVFQTDAGRMIFVKPKEQEKPKRSFFTPPRFNKIFRSPRFFGRSSNKKNNKNNKNKQNNKRK